ncbi:MAG: Spy/CpxP family protein refolding chaperone [Betaproteobacteria bacterium]
MAGIAWLAFVSLPAVAQHQGYAAAKDREIKALSPEQVQQYQAGAGMGYAMPAELNRFPGPMHVLELADKLLLTPDQRAKTQALMDAHKAEARVIGAKRVESERALESLFRSGKVDEAALAKHVRDAAALEGEFRLAHLETHRRTRVLLTEEQVARYVKLRGYGNGGSPSGHGGHRH